MSDEPKEGHEAMVSPPTLKLGEMHWYILRAATLMDSQTAMKKKSGESLSFVLCFAKILCALKIARFPAATAFPSRLSLPP